MRDFAFCVGLLLVAVGAGLIYLPAGLIVAGIELSAAVYLSTPSEQNEADGSTDQHPA